MHYCSLVGVAGDFVVSGPSVEEVKEELEMAVIRVVVVDGGGKGGVVHVFPPSTGVHHGVVYKHQEASHPGPLGDCTGEVLRGGEVAP